MHGGIWNEYHAAALAAARVRVQRGGPEAPLCGARTRTGAVCQQPPIREGKGRCLHHAGPHAARLFRERQRQGFLSGKISADVWRRTEARRAANRLCWEWKKNPWTLGGTIDLGEAEGELRAALIEAGLDVDALAPAVADWLRWRYRRTQIDRRDELAWQSVVYTALPERIAKAGDRPADIMPLAASESAQTWTPEAFTVDPRSKRQRPDQPRAPKLIRTKGYGRRGRPRTQKPKGDEMDELMEVYRAHRIAVAPMMERCQSEGERLAVLRALRDYTADPNEKGPREQWHAVVQQLGR